MKIEHKSIGFELKAFDEEQGVFEGYAAVFNNVDDGNDRILPGAFQKAIKEWGPTGKNRVKVLALHNNEWLPIGKPIEMNEDANGLFVKAKISDTTMGKDVKTLIKDGVFTELSIGYNATDYFYDNQKVRNIKEATLFEFSPVIWAMNAAAGINSYKSNEKGGENLELKVGTKAFSFNQVLEMEELNRLRYRVREALQQSISSIMIDDKLNNVQKLASIDMTLSEYHKTCIEMYKRILEMQEKEQKELDATEMLQKASSIFISEHKAGASISKANQDRLMGVMKAVSEMMGYNWADMEKAMSGNSDEVDEETKEMIKKQILEFKSITQGGNE